MRRSHRCGGISRPRRRGLEKQRGGDRRRPGRNSVRQALTAHLPGVRRGTLFRARLPVEHRDGQRRATRTRCVRGHLATRRIRGRIRLGRSRSAAVPQRESLRAGEGHDSSLCRPAPSHRDRDPHRVRQRGRRSRRAGVRRGKSRARSRRLDVGPVSAIRRALVDRRCGCPHGSGRGLPRGGGLDHRSRRSARRRDQRLAAHRAVPGSAPGRRGTGVGRVGDRVTRLRAQERLSFGHPRSVRWNRFGGRRHHRRRCPRR